MLQITSGPRPSRQSKRACHTCHGVTRVARVVELLVFRILSLVDRRATSAMTAIRARDSNGWPSFRADEMVSVDCVSATV